MGTLNDEELKQFVQAVKDAELIDEFEWKSDNEYDESKVLSFELN